MIKKQVFYKNKNIGYFDYTDKKLSNIPSGITVPDDLIEKIQNLKNWVFIHDFVVYDEFLGKGYSQKIIDDVINFCYDNKYTNIITLTNDIAKERLVRNIKKSLSKEKINIVFLN